MPTSLRFSTFGFTYSAFLAFSMSRIFHPCKFVPHFHCAAFSTPSVLCRIFTSRNFMSRIFSGPLLLLPENPGNPAVFKPVNPGLCAGKNPGLTAVTTYNAAKNLKQLRYNNTINNPNPMIVFMVNRLLTDIIN